MSNIVASSPETRNWLELIIFGVTEHIPQLEYTESKYWGAFRNPATNRNIAYLKPTKKKIRLHTKLPLTYNNALEATSASKHWAETCPSIFRINSKSDVEKAISIIAECYSYDSSPK